MRRRRRKQREPLNVDPRTINYKNIPLLQTVLSNYAKILPARYLGVTTKHQRQLSKAAKRARFMALLPYVRY